MVERYIDTTIAQRRPDDLYWRELRKILYMSVYRDLDHFVNK